MKRSSIAAYNYEKYQNETGGKHSLYNLKYSKLNLHRPNRDHQLHSYCNYLSIHTGSTSYIKFIFEVNIIRSKLPKPNA